MNKGEKTNEEYVPYSEYPLWELREWKDRAKRSGDYEFVRICEEAIASKEVDDAIHNVVISRRT